jgi:hypothetical protein
LDYSGLAGAAPTNHWQGAKEGRRRRVPILEQLDLHVGIVYELAHFSEVITKLAIWVELATL